MKTSNILSALLLAGASSAQTPAGFTPVVTQKLEVTFGTKNIATPGQAMSKTDTSRQPTIGLNGPANGTYIWMMIGKFVLRSYVAFHIPFNLGKMLTVPRQILMRTVPISY